MGHNIDDLLKVRISRCAKSLVTYGVRKAHVIPRDLRAFPANFLPSRLKTYVLQTYYELDNIKEA